MVSFVPPCYDMTPFTSSQDLSSYLLSAKSRVSAIIYTAPYTWLPAMRMSFSSYVFKQRIS